MEESPLLKSGTKLGHYVIQEKIAEGGMGVIYKALEPALERYVALKILHPSSTYDSEAQANFLEEARAVASLRHNNIVPLYYVGEEKEIRYFAMAYIEGGTMEQWIDQDRSLDAEWAKWFLEQAISALDYAARFDIIHLDVKPSNFIVDPDHIVMLTDFGVAQRRRHIIETGEQKEILGTPCYASPEHILQKPPDRRTDIYCLGATLFHLMTTFLPYQGDSVEEVCRGHIMSPFPKQLALDQKVPLEWIALIEKMMEKKPEDRFQDYTELHLALQEMDSPYLTPIDIQEEANPIEVEEEVSFEDSPENLFGILPPALAKGDLSRYEIKKIYSPQECEEHLDRRDSILAINTLVEPLRDLLQPHPGELSELLCAVGELPFFGQTVDELTSFMGKFTDAPLDDLPEKLELLGLTRANNLALTIWMLEKKEWKSKRSLHWSSLWQRQVACGLLLEMMVDMLQIEPTGWEYVAGLFHDVGKILMSELFPNQYIGALRNAMEKKLPLTSIEEEAFGLTHTTLAALWMQKHNLHKNFTQVIEYQDVPGYFPSPGLLSGALPDLGIGRWSCGQMPLLVHGLCSVKHLLQELSIGFSGEAWKEEQSWKDHPSTQLLWKHRGVEELTWEEFIDFFLKGCKNFPSLSLAQLGIASP